MSGERFAAKIAAGIARGLKESTCFDLSILVWSLDILNSSELLGGILPDAVDHFADELEDGGDVGMFWFDFANVVALHVPPKRTEAFDAKFFRSFLEPVESTLLNLSGTEVPHAQALDAWQELLHERQIPYLGPHYTGTVLSQLGVRIV
mmetsp:Transcript_102126/g.329439  ORF Transcript_102126/g.329439 Transcript_102126/m.329439 type:complete len:149 (-) Transcript_102126:7-453(-)